MTAQRRVPFVALLVIGAGMIVGCGGGTKSVTTQQVTETKPTATPDEIPSDVTYSILDEQIIPGIKRSLDVRLNRKVSEGVLRMIALKLKGADSKKYERTFIGYYLPEMTVGAGAWATTHFNPNLEIRILSLTVEQENALKQVVDEPTRQIIGVWLHDKEWLAARITLFRQDGELQMETTYKDGSSGKQKMVEKPSSQGRKFMAADRTGPNNDYYLIDDQGRLQIWSQDVDGKHVLVSTAKVLNKVVVENEPKPNDMTKPPDKQPTSESGGEEREFDVGNGVKMRFCWIPPSKGKVRLGSPKAEQDYITKTFYKGKRPAWLDAENEFEIEGLDGFWMAKTEMTQAQYTKIIGANPSCFCETGTAAGKVRGKNTSDFPVERVSWDESQVCIQKMTVPTELKGWKIALPSEAQWEYAYRGGKGNGQPYYWGNALNGDRANSNGEFPYGTTVKGSFLNRTEAVRKYEKQAPHPWGLCDMSGNVYEWCQDYYGPYRNLPHIKNPVQTQRQTVNERVIRGGSYFHAYREYISVFCRGAGRDHSAPTNQNDAVGFRVVLLP